MLFTALTHHFFLALSIIPLSSCTTASFFPLCKCILLSQHGWSLFLLLLSLFFSHDYYDQQKATKVLFWNFWTQSIRELEPSSSFFFFPSWNAHARLWGSPNSHMDRHTQKNTGTQENSSRRAPRQQPALTFTEAILDLPLIPVP